MEPILEILQIAKTFERLFPVLLCDTLDTRSMLLFPDQPLLTDIHDISSMPTALPMLVLSLECIFAFLRFLIWNPRFLETICLCLFPAAKPAYLLALGKEIFG